METPTKEWLIHNAIHCWLYTVKDEDHPWRKLYLELENEFNPKIKTQKRGRPAKRARKKATSSIEASKEKVETPKEQT